MGRGTRWAGAKGLKEKQRDNIRDRTEDVRDYLDLAFPYIPLAF